MVHVLCQRPSRAFTRPALASGRAPGTSTTTGSLQAVGEPPRRSRSPASVVWVLRELGDDRWAPQDEETVG